MYIYCKSAASCRVDYLCSALLGWDCIENQLNLISFSTPLTIIADASAKSREGDQAASRRKVMDANKMESSSSSTDHDTGDNLYDGTSFRDQNERRIKSNLIRLSEEVRGDGMDDEVDDIIDYDGITLAKTKAKITETLRDSCLPKMLCEMAARPSQLLSNRERDLLSLIK